MVAEFDRRRDVVVEGLNESAGRLLRDAEGRVLRLPQRHAHRLEGEGAGLRRCWKMPASRSSAGRISAFWAKAICALSYANSTENIQKALARMGEFLSSRKAA